MMSDIPAQHAGLLFEQIQIAATAAVGHLRTFGLPLPGSTKVPNYWDVRSYIRQMVNRALDGYFETKRQAPPKANVWGMDEDDLFRIKVMALDPANDEGGFTAEIHMNLLYGGEDAA